MKEKSILTTVKTILATWSHNKAGKSPVKIRITDNRVSQFFSVLVDGQKLFLDTHQWQDILSNKNHRGEKKEIRKAIDQAKLKADRAIQEITKNDLPFTFERFRLEYLGNKSVTAKGFLSLFKSHLEVIRTEQRIGTFLAYKNAFTAFNKFRGGSKITYPGTRKQSDKIGRELNPVDLTADLLNQFETYLKNSGSGKTTIGIYMRSLKVIYNLATDANPSLKEHYPFATRASDRKKYKLKTGSGHKGEAMTIDQIKVLKSIATEPGSLHHEAKQLWLFSFYCQGMNFKDMSLLKYSQTVDNKISFVREKTKNAGKETLIEIPISDSIRAIIADIGNPDKRKTAYVFNVIAPGMDLEKMDAVVRQKIKMVNARLGDLCEANDLPSITTYWARHSYASLLKEDEVPVDQIRELLGHSDVRTTQSYLKRFDIDVTREINERLENRLNKTA